MIELDLWIDRSFHFKFSTACDSGNLCNAKPKYLAGTLSKDPLLLFTEAAWPMKKRAPTAEEGMNERRRQVQNLQTAFTFPHCPSFKFENTHWLEITDRGRGVSASMSNVTANRQGDPVHP